VHAYEVDGIRYRDAVDAGLSDHLGPYPFRAAGGIVDDTRDLGFALETRTRRSTQGASPPTRCPATWSWCRNWPTGGPATWCCSRGGETAG
jgi:hypothetical protein